MKILHGETLVSAQKRELVIPSVLETSQIFKL